jgi:hydroxylaminobenzene mutase
MDHDRRLIRQGFLLFLLALAGGLFAYGARNPRMAVAAHVEGLMNGMFLVLLGSRTKVVAFWAALIGAYANWLVPLFSAAVGASQPQLAGAGFKAAPWQEALLAASPVAGVLAPLVCCSLLVWGMRGRAAA